MSGGKRKRTYCRNPHQSRKASITCLAVIYLILCSCTHLPKKEDQSIHKVINDICFSAEGRGRMEIPGGKYVFNFETQLNREKKRWSFAFHFPLGRQEILHLNYGDEVQASGAFYQKISKSLSPRQLRELNTFMEFVGAFATVKTQNRGEELFELSIEGHQTILKMANKSQSPSLSLKTLDDYYRRMFIEYLDKTNNKMKLMLYLSSCSAT